MQSSCPQCQQGIVIDDAKIPDRAFSVRCPRCKATVRFPGKGAAPQAGPAAPDNEPETIPPTPALNSPTATAPVASPGPATTPAPISEEVRAHLMAQLRREMALGDSASAGRALVALADEAHAGTVALTLTRQGYAVDTLDNAEEGGHLLEQGIFSLVATQRPAKGARGDTLFQRLSRLNSQARRRVFVVLVGDEFRTGDILQSFAVAADLVVSPRDLGAFDAQLRGALAERQRMYQAYLDARRRFESAD